MNPIKFACKKDEICAAIGNVSKAVSPKSTITALEGIRLLLNGTSLELTGYDLEIGITTVIEVDSEDRGEIVLNSRLFSEITRRMPSDTVYFEVDENLNMKISGGNAQYQISAISAEEYPALPGYFKRKRYFSQSGNTKKHDKPDKLCRFSFGYKADSDRRAFRH